MLWYRWCKIKRVIQGGIGIWLMLLIHRYFIIQLETNETILMAVSVLAVAIGLVVMYQIKEELVQLVKSYRTIEKVIDIRTECMMYNWECVKEVPESGTYFIRYIKHKNQNMVVRVGICRSEGETK